MVGGFPFAECAGELYSVLVSVSAGNSLSLFNDSASCLETPLRDDRLLLVMADNECY